MTASDRRWLQALAPFGAIFAAVDLTCVVRDVRAGRDRMDGTTACCGLRRLALHRTGSVLIVAVLVGFPLWLAHHIFAHIDWKRVLP